MSQLYDFIDAAFVLVPVLVATLGLVKLARVAFSPDTKTA